MISMEAEDHIEPLSQFNENELDACSSANESFLEYHVPLEDFTGVDQRPRTFSKNDIDNGKGRSIPRLDAHFAGEGESYEHGISYVGESHKKNDDDDYLCSDYNQKQQRGSQQPGNDESVQPNRRRISGQSVSFKSSVEHSIASDHDHNTTKKDDCNNNTPSKQNRSMEIRMDGHVLQVAHSDTKKVNAIYPASGNMHPTTLAKNLAESTKASLSWVDSDGEFDDVKNDGDHQCSRSQQESSFDGSNQVIIGCLDGDFSFNTNTSESPATFRPSSDHNNISISSSEGTFRMKPSSYSMNGARGRDQGVVILEENATAGASFDESDTSNTSGTGLTRRVKDIFNLHTISILIVKWIPYVCLCCFSNNHELRGSVFSDRFILARLNILSFFFSATTLVASLWLIVVIFVEGNINTYWDDHQHKFHLWNNNGSIVLIGCLAFVLLFTCFWTARIVKEVDLVGALRFLWLLLWILPIAVFLNITAFDYHEVTSAWIRHNWNSMQLWWFRNHLCFPETAESLCMVPIKGGFNYTSEDEWCLGRYNTTGCTEIRDEAQKQTSFILLCFYRSLASWGCIYMFIMLLIIKSLERIISKPMVQKSREVNVVSWLTFPVLCTALYGSVILFSPYTYFDKLIQPRLIGYLYLITSGLFLIALLMGWILSAFSIRSNVDKQNKSNAALILVVVLFINAFVLLTIMMSSIVWSRNLDLDDGERGSIACTLNNSECTNCDDRIAAFRCPEWNFEEITNIVCRQLIQSAVMAAIFILYDLNVMIHGFNLRKHLSMYQIDYV